jgi:hypothetical protein
MIVNSWYNGYSPQERDKKYKIMQLLIKSGDLAKPSGPCDLCNDPDADVEYHDEDYAEPYIWTKPALLTLCRHCHRYKLHKRFKNTNLWFSFVAHIRRGGYASDLKNQEVAKELKRYQKAISQNLTYELTVLRPYKKEIGREWFESLRMDIQSLNDPSARPR